MLSGAQVIRKVRTWSPQTTTAAHVGHDAWIPSLLQAGASATWSRRVCPADVGHALSELLPLEEQADR